MWKNIYSINVSILKSLVFKNISRNKDRLKFYEKMSLIIFKDFIKFTFYLLNECRSIKTIPSIFLNTRKTQSDDTCFDSRLPRIKIKTWLSTLARVPWKMAQVSRTLLEEILAWKLHKVLKRRGRVPWHGRWNLNRSNFLRNPVKIVQNRVLPPWRGLILLDRVGDPRLNSRQIADVKEGRGLNRSPPSQRIKRGNSVSSCATFADSWLVNRWQVKLVDTELTPDRCCLKRVSDRTLFTFRAFERFYDTLDNCGRSRLEDRVWK